MSRGTQCQQQPWGWCLSGVGEAEPVSQSWCASGHFCQSPLDKFLLLVLSALAVGKKLFSCTFWTGSWQRKPSSASLPQKLQRSRGDVKVQGRESSSLLPAPQGLSSKLFLVRPRQDGAGRGQCCSLKRENPAPHNGVSCQKLSHESSLESLCTVVSFHQVSPQRT